MQKATDYNRITDTFIILTYITPILPCIVAHIQYTVACCQRENSSSSISLYRNSFSIQSVALKFCVTAWLIHKDNVLVLAETAFMVSSAYVGSMGNDFYIFSALYRYRLNQALAYFIYWQTTSGTRPELPLKLSKPIPLESLLHFYPVEQWDKSHREIHNSDRLQ